MASSRRIYDTTTKKFLIATGIGIPLIFGVFLLLAQRGDITITGHSGDMICAGTIQDPCYAYINFTANVDIFLYTKDATWTAFNTSVPMKEIILQRSWGSGWRTINLQEGCTGSWCGCYWCRADNTAEYSIVFRNRTSYQLRFIGYKNYPSDVVHWSFGDIK